MLAQDLGDANKVFFTADELQRSLVEALRLSNALTARTRLTVTFSAVAGQAWYNLTAIAPAALASTVTDRSTVELMQYRMMEPVEPSAGVGMTEMYAHDEMVRTLEQARDRFLVETETSITRRAAQTNIEFDGTVKLDESIARVMRIVWSDNLGRRTVLRNSSDEGIMSASRLDRRINYGTPRRWSIVSSPQLVLQLDPVPDGRPRDEALELTTIETGTSLSTTANSNTGTVLGVPDDLAAGVMWDSLELLLSKHGIGHDSARAQFAGQLGTVMRAVASNLPTVLEVLVRDVNIRIGHVSYLDAKDSGWEGRTRDIPRRAAVMGDWLALYPVPDDVFPITVTLVSQLPALDLTDHVQIGREHLSGLLAWAKQLLLFKVGGQPLAKAAQTAGLLIEQARQFNESRVRSCAYLAEYLSQGMETFPSTTRSAPAPDLSGDPRDDASTHNARQRSSTYTPYARKIGGR